MTIKTEETSVADIKYSNTDFLKSLILFIRPYKFEFIKASFARLLSDIVWLYSAYALASIVNFFVAYKAGDSLIEIWIIFSIWTIVSIIHFYGRYYSKYRGFKVAERIVLDAYIKTINQMFKLDLVWHTKLNSGNKLKKNQKGADGFDKVIRIWFNIII